MKINPVQNYNITPFRGKIENAPKEENSFDNFTNLVQNEAKTIGNMAQIVCKNSGILKQKANMLKGDAEAYKELLKIFMEDKNWKNSLEEDENILMSQENGNLHFLVTNEDGEIQRTSTIYKDKSCIFRLPIKGNEKKINCYRSDPNLKEISVILGLDTSNSDLIKTDKSFIIKDGKLTEYQEGKTETPDFLEIKKVFNFENEKLKSFYDNYRFNGMTGSISSVYKFNDNEFISEYANKRIFNFADKQDQSEFLFNGHRNYIYEGNSTTLEVKDGKPVEITKYLKENESPIQSIKLDFKALENSSKN